MDNREPRKHQKPMERPWGSVNRVEALKLQELRHPSTKSRRPLPNIKNHVEHLAIEAGDEFALRVFALDVHPSQNSPVAEGGILLNEFREAFNALPEDLGKVPSLVDKHITLVREGAFNFGDGFDKVSGLG